jgi:hypothetical protein
VLAGIQKIMKEGDKISNIKLTKNWDETLKFYDDLISKNFNLRPIRFLIRHIISNNYSDKLFSGTSLYDLLISLPENDKVNFNKTLKINFNQKNQIVKFNYSQLDRFEKTKQNQTWTIECQATEINETFEYFLLLHDEWNSIKS